MNARNAHIVQAHDARPERLGGQRRFLGAVQIRRARTRHGNVARAARCGHATINADAGNLVVGEGKCARRARPFSVRLFQGLRRRSVRMPRQRLFNRTGLGGVEARDKHALLPRFGQGSANAGDLLGGLPGSVDDLAGAGTRGAAGVYLREAEVVKAALRKTRVRLFDAYRALGNLRKKIVE